MEKRDDFVLYRQDMLLLLVLHAVVALSIVAEKERQPVARHFFEKRSKIIKLN